CWTRTELTGPKTGGSSRLLAQIIETSSYENFPDIFEKRSYENQYWINIVFEILLDIKLINLITPNKTPLLISYYVT
ncbi:hypothetical protein BpHYR1_030579, partial [Brachionus plicatilis]